MARLARQLRKPTGLYGRFVAARRLSRINGYVNEATLAALEIKPADRVLEVGFGPGDLIHGAASLAAEGIVVGVDFSPDMVALCHRRFARLLKAGRVELFCAEAEALPFDSGTFTKACSVNTIYFWDEPAVPLREFSRVLLEGGKLVVTFSTRETMKDLPVVQYGFNLYEADEVGALLERSGFREIELIPGDGPHGEFVCACAIKGDTAAVQHAHPADSGAHEVDSG